MREWRESRQAEVVAALEMPADLKKVIEISIGQVWNTANRLASVNIETVRKEADAAIETITGERDEALTEITRLESKVDELVKLLSDKEGEVGQVKTGMEKMRVQNAELTVNDN